MNMSLFRFITVLGILVSWVPFMHAEVTKNTQDIETKKTVRAPLLSKKAIAALVIAGFAAVQGIPYGMKQYAHYQLNMFRNKVKTSNVSLKDFLAFAHINSEGFKLFKKKYQASEFTIQDESSAKKIKITANATIHVDNIPMLQDEEKGYFRFKKVFEDFNHFVGDTHWIVIGNYDKKTKTALFTIVINDPYFA